jgi:hypothetical protein
MVREDLREVDVLCCVDEKTPPEDVEEDEEDCGIETSCIRRSEELGGQRTEEDDGHDTAARSDEHEGASSEAVDGQGCHRIAEDRERCPDCVEEEWDATGETKACVDQDTVVC